MKIASLIASSTEIVCALGYEKHLVARSHECDYPLSIRKLPQVTRPGFATTGSSREIDEEVKKGIQKGQDAASKAVSIYEVDQAALQALNPDVILTQSQCEVCAVSLHEVEIAISEWLGRKPQIVSLQPNCLADIWEDIRKIARALETESRGERLITALKGRMQGISRVASRLNRSAAPRVACLEWIEPLMAAGNWMPELVELAGGVNLFGEAGRHSPWMTLDQLAAQDPDVIIVMPCGFDLKKTQEEMSVLIAEPIWQSLRAVQNSQVYLADGNQFFNRPGPRVVDALEILLEILYPGQVDAGHAGTGWKKFSVS